MEELALGLGETIVHAIEDAIKALVVPGEASLHLTAQLLHLATQEINVLVEALNHVVDPLVGPDVSFHRESNDAWARCKALALNVPRRWRAIMQP